MAIQHRQQSLAREVGDVLISYLNEDDDANETARVVRENGRTCIAVPGDIADEPHCRQIVEPAVVGVQPAGPARQ
jgi:hypothetical protein